MKRSYTCVICPNSCFLDVEIREGNVISVSGNQCGRGREWVIGEVTDPRRNFATSVKVRGGEMETVSVRLSSPIPRAMIFPVMAEIRKAEAKAPVHIGDVIISNVLSLGCDVIATRDVAAAGM